MPRSIKNLSFSREKVIDEVDAESESYNEDDYDECIIISPARDISLSP